MAIKVLVMGATGMLGNAMVRALQEDKNFKIWASVRGSHNYKNLRFNEEVQILHGVDVNQERCISDAFKKVNPEIVINCIGIVKQATGISDASQTIYINSLLPHRLLFYCGAYKARLIHISTDCVFSGKKGNYSEEDYADSDDLYGRSKFLGEVSSERDLTL
jgi:dTDP-4-dehydrorhamnose reductase